MIDTAPEIRIVVILTVGFALACILGYMAQRFKLSPFLGYLIAGYLIGPFSPGFVADLHVAEQLAEIGVILMMFGVGLHFKWEDLMNVRRIAVPGAIGQTLVTSIIGTLLVYHLGWSIPAGIILGVAIAVASTVVLIRVLSDNNLLNTPQGHVAIGWLIVEDILTVIVLLLLPVLGEISHGLSPSFISIFSAIGIVLLKFLILVALMFTVGRKFVTFAVAHIARTRSQELFTLAILALTFVIATGSSMLFGTSIALGAFIAGMVIGTTNVRHQASINALPIKDAFAVIFFLAVGMLFNPNAIMNHFGLFIAVLAIILIVKPLAAFFIVIFLKHPFKTALTVALALAQIGEFSFILAEEATRLDILPDEGYDAIVASALISIAINPVLFKFINPLLEYFGYKAHSSLNEQNPDSQMQEIDERKAIVVGYGPIGQKVAKILMDLGFTPVVIDLNVDTISKLLDENRLAVYGDASDHHILEVAQIKSASLLLITIPEFEKSKNIIHEAQLLNKNIRIVVRVRYVADKVELSRAGVEYICCEEQASKEFERFLYSFNEDFFIRKNLI